MENTTVDPEPGNTAVAAQDNPVNEQESVAQSNIKKPRTLTFDAMSITGGNLVTHGNPIHEMLTIAALINSDYKLSSTLTYYQLRHHPQFQPDTNDFIRGAVWNDDPEDELFEDTDPANNIEYSTGYKWLQKFKFGGFTKPELIHRSHWGDLQWLHAMGSTYGEQPSDTKHKALCWMETMYSLAIGTLDPSTAIEKTKVGGFFDDPANYTSIGELLTRRHRVPTTITHRALGSCFHVIQDSYAIGHCRRECLNPQDMLPRGPDGYIRFKAGVADRWGAVLNFHTYQGQDSKAHEYYDHENGYVDGIQMAQLDDWNNFIGCRDGVDNCIILANYWHRQAPWSEVYSWLDTSVFLISEKATPSDNSIG